ncbi:MAG: PorP/SprF family type IX secretion system membrane protein [bacterium]|nr:PorP/SprF family type IX secretion system membrane protein [bacterium]
MIKNRIIFFLLIVTKVLVAQDVHFSQYYFSPLSMNPAYTGNFKGDYRLFANYRSQWRALDKGYDTYSAGGDMNFFPKNFNLAAGLIILSDRSAQYLNVTKILPSFAVHRKIAGFKLHAGIQPGVVIKTFDFYKHSYPNQLNWDVGAFDKNLPNNESNISQNFTYFDLNAGAAVSRKFGKIEPELGFALFHINHPKESFFAGGTNKLPLRQAYNMAINIDVTRLVIVRLHSLYGYTTKTSDWVSGLNLEYVLSRDAFYTNSVFAGVMWRDGFNRNFDAAIITAGFNYKSYTIGFSYDITRSQLKTSVDSKGAYEIAIIYRAKNTRLSRKIVPCERF